MGKMITFRVSDREYEIIKQLAKEAIAMSLSDYCRLMVLQVERNSNDEQKEDC